MLIKVVPQYAVIIGENEVAAQRYGFKALREETEQQTFTVEQIIKKLQ